MHRLKTISILALLLALGSAWACGGKKKADDAADKKDTSSSKDEDSGAGGMASTDSDGGTSDAPPKKDECVGFDIPNIEDLLLKSSCEETTKPDAFQNVDMKGKLEVTVGAVPTKLGAGGKTE